jgi:hypothetical protein
VIPKPSLRRTLATSLALHAMAAIVAGWTIGPAHVTSPELVDIEVAPPPPLPEALPPEVAKPPGEGVLDAGVDAAPDAARDAAIDARPDAAIDARPDAAIDAAPGSPPDAGPPDDAAPPGPPDAMTVAGSDVEPPDHGDAGTEVTAAGAPGDAGSDDAQVAVALADAGDDAAQVALGDAGDTRVAVGAAPGSGSSAGTASGTGSGEAPGGAALDTAALAAALGSAAPGATNEPAVEGEPTTAGTAANLLAYFPDGHVVTALIRFDRLRGTEWAAQTERLLRPMPDYQILFGTHDAAIADKLEALVISTPRPRDAAATTLVARTTLTRAALRGFLGAAAPVTWSTARGGLLGKRGGKLVPGDQRVFLSPFGGWFLLAQPGDLGALTGAAKGSLDAAVATAKLPPWLAGIRKIETETGDARGPALVVTLGLGGKRVDLAGNDFGLGLPSVPTPDRISLAMELVKQGWLVRGNLRFASDADATELIAAVQRVQQRIAGSRTIQLVIGKPIARVIANLAFARTGPRVSYATSISIADARAILAVVAQQLDQYFGHVPEAAPTPPGRR